MSRTFVVFNSRQVKEIERICQQGEKEQALRFLTEEVLKRINRRQPCSKSSRQRYRYR